MDVRAEHPRPLPLWVLFAVDAIAAVVLLVVGAAEMRAVGDDLSFRAFDGWAFALVVLQTLPAALRRLLPIPALAVCVAAQAVALYAGYPPTNALLAAPLALYLVAFNHSRRVSAAITAASALVIAPWAFTDASSATQLVLLNAVVLGAAALAGDASKARRLYAETIEERARQAVERRDADMREAVVEERARIARELHDAVGHTVNVLVVHAGAGRVAAAQDPQRAAAALGEIETIGRSALSDIDRLLGLLRDDGQAERQPTHRIECRAVDARGVAQGSGGDGRGRVPHGAGGAHQRHQARRTRHRAGLDRGRHRPDHHDRGRRTWGWCNRREQPDRARRPGPDRDARAGLAARWPARRRPPPRRWLSRARTAAPAAA